MSDGITDMYQREDMERKKKLQKLKEDFAKIIDDYKWIMANEIVEAFMRSTDD